jgi:hypothetical protein
MSYGEEKRKKPFSIQIKGGLNGRLFFENERH